MVVGRQEKGGQIAGHIMTSGFTIHVVGMRALNAALLGCALVLGVALWIPTGSAQVLMRPNLRSQERDGSQTFAAHWAVGQVFCNRIAARDYDRAVLALRFYCERWLHRHGLVPQRRHAACQTFATRSLIVPPGLKKPSCGAGGGVC